MRDDILDLDMLDLGPATALTLGEPQELASENVTIKDFWD